MVMLSGRFMKKFNFYKWVIFGILLIGIGYMIVVYVINYFIFILGYGVFIGIGVGIFYGIFV